MEVGKMTKKITLAIVLAIVAVLGMGMVSAFGFGNKMSDEKREAMRNVIENNDYFEWRALKESMLTEENFNEIRAKHMERTEIRNSMQEEREDFRNVLKEARENGDLEKMQELKAQFGKGKQFHKRNMNLEDCPFSE